MRKSMCIAVCVMILISSLCLGCKKKEKKYARPVSGSEAYPCAFYKIPIKEGFDAHFSGIFPDEGGFCVTVFYSSKTGEAAHTDLCSINEKGEVTYTLEIIGHHLPDAVFKDEYAFLDTPSSDLLDENDASQAD